MAKQVIYKDNLKGCYVMTPLSNYYAYVQDARKKHVLTNVKTLQDVQDFILNLCDLYNDSEENYIVL